MVYRQTEGTGKFVGGFKADPIDIPLQLIGILLNNFQRLIAIGLVDLDRQAGAHTVPVQEHHDFFDLFLFLPGFGDLVRSIHTDSRDFEQPTGCLFDHIEGLFLEFPHNPLRQLGTDPFDHPGSEISLNASDRCRQGLFTDFCFELRAVVGMPGPLSLQLEEFPGRNFGQIANHSSQPIDAQAGLGCRVYPFLVFRTQAQYGVSILRIVKRDAFHRAGERVHIIKYTRRREELWLDLSRISS